jgi:hypothetical protein
MLNDYYYYTLICPYIDIKDRQICSRRDVHLIADKNPKKQLLNAIIFLHMGTPCIPRFCICRHFNDADVIRAYNRSNEIQLLLHL